MTCVYNKIYHLFLIRNNCFLTWHRTLQDFVILYNICSIIYLFFILVVCLKLYNYKLNHLTWHYRTFSFFCYENWRELSFFLFTLYTTFFQFNSDLCDLKNFSGDSTVVGCIRVRQEEGYRELKLVEWRGKNHLVHQLVVVDFRWQRTTTRTINIMEQDVEIVDLQMP